MIGVHKYAGIDLTRNRKLCTDDVVAKVMMCGDYLYEWQSDWTMSKIDQ